MIEKYKKAKGKKIDYSKEDKEVYLI